MARQWIEQGNTIILLGQDVNAIMRRVRMPLMTLDASKDSDRININSVFFRKSVRPRGTRIWHST